MTIGVIILFAFIAMTLLGAIGVLLTNNVLLSAFYLLASFLGMAGLFVLKGAAFVGVTQIMVYVGGVLILMIFGIMYTARTSNEKKILSPGGNYILGAGVGVFLFAILSRSIIKREQIKNETIELPIQELGKSFMTEYIFAFELIAIILLVVLIGAVYVAAKRKSENG